MGICNGDWSGFAREDGGKIVVVGLYVAAGRVKEFDGEIGESRAHGDREDEVESAGDFGDQEYRHYRAWTIPQKCPP